MAGSFGPLSPEEFKKLVDAPYGRAVNVIRRFDPLYGKTSSEGEKVKWRVTLHQDVTMSASVTVEAATEEEAEILAEAMDDDKLNWDYENNESSYVVNVRRV